MMPGLNGIELLQQTHQAGVVVPFIFITSEVTKEVVMQAARAGATEFIAKPVTPDVLYAKVDRVLARHAKA
ncbi:response regulator [Alteromonas sp. CYL-A6]|uniref:response regulator n=1 Tax=Alteromonas nitratireducens TaxID=3390813 RepID=UPI0034C3358F